MVAPMHREMVTTLFNFNSHIYAALHTKSFSPSVSLSFTGSYIVVATSYVVILVSLQPYTALSAI